MYTNCDVQAAIRCLPVTESYSDELMEYCGEKAISYVASRLKEGIDEDNPLVLSTAVAMAEFFLSLYSGKEGDNYDTYSVGDLTFRRNCEREFKLAVAKRDEALALAAEILKDGDFYFAGT